MQPWAVDRAKAHGPVSHFRRTCANHLDCLNNLAELYQAQGNYADAEPLYQRSRTILERALGLEHPNVAQSLENYAALLRKTGRPKKAAKMEAHANAIRAKYE